MSTFKSSKIYIAGHNGMVGSACIRKFKSKGYYNLIFFGSKELDLRDQKKVESFISSEKPDIIIDAAAVVGGIWANNEYPYKFLMENMLIQNNLIKSAVDNKVKKFIFLGSSCIYPKLAPQPLKEEYLLSSTLEPTNQWYAIAKISGVDEFIAKHPSGYNLILKERGEGLSGGQRQSISLCRAMLHNPSVIILDEPTTGLDPNQLIEIRALIQQLGKDKTVLFSTHIMQEVEAICDRVIIINKGQIVQDSKLAELQDKQQQNINIVFDSKVTLSKMNQLKNLISLKNIENNTWLLSFTNDEDMRPKLFDFAKENKVKILELTAHNKNLETLFREFTN